MIIKTFIFNPYQVNTYVVSDETKQCVIIDPGCYFDREKEVLTEYIEKENLTPVKILNTHTHFDHVLGNNFVSKTYNVDIFFHKDDEEIYNMAVHSAKTFGLHIDEPEKPSGFIKNEEIISFGKTKLNAIHAPGHSPGSLIFSNPEQKILFTGDVLFYESIGRTDLPKGNMQQLLKSIKEKIFTLDKTTSVFPGHGNATSIEHEIKYNPFLQDDFYY